MRVVLGATSEPAIHFHEKQQNNCFASTSVKKNRISLIFCIGLVHGDLLGQVWVPGWMLDKTMGDRHVGMGSGQYGSILGCQGHVT